MQKFKAVLLAVVVMVVSVSTCLSTAYAASGKEITRGQDIVITPRYIYAGFVETNLSISGKTAEVYISLDGNSSAKSVSVTYSLQRKSGSSWSTVKSWSASSNTRYINVQSSYSSLVSGAQYRVYATFTVTGKDGKKETITDYSSTYTC